MLLCLLMGQSMFANAYGGTSMESLYRVIPTYDQGCLMVGGSFSYGYNNFDVMAIKLDPDGGVQWTKVFGSPFNDEEAYNAIQLPDSSFVLVGYTFSYGAGSADMLLMGLDKDGSLSWSMVIGGSNEDRAYAVQQTSDNGYIVVGKTLSYGNAGNYDAFAVKLNASRTVQWARTYGGTVADYAYDVVIPPAPDSGYAIAGGTASYGGTSGDNVLLWKLRPGGLNQFVAVYSGDSTEFAEDIEPKTGGGYILTGRTNSFDADSDDVLVISVSETGALDWAHILGGSANDWGHQACQAPDSTVVVAAETRSYGAGLTDFLAFGLAPNGSYSWAWTWGGTGSEILNSVDVDVNNYLLFAGITGSFGQGNNDAALIKTDSTGAFANCVQDCSPDHAAVVLTEGNYATLRAATPGTSDISPSVFDTVPDITVLCQFVEMQEIKPERQIITCAPVSHGLVFRCSRRIQGLSLFSADGRLIRKLNLKKGENRIILQPGVFLWRWQGITGKAAVVR